MRLNWTRGGIGTFIGWSLLAMLPGAAWGQVSPERAPKTAAELQRQSGHVWDLAHSTRVESVRPLKTKAYRRAVDDFRAGNTDLRRDLTVSWGEFVSGTGKPFLALALDRPTDADLEPGKKVTLFGEIVDAAGKVVASFEADDEAELAAGRSIVDVALPLPAGGTRALLGIAIGKQVRWLLEQPLEVRAVPTVDAGGFALSRPVLSLDVHPLAEPQQPDDPFCFGGLRVAPRGDRAFRPTDEPWLFTVVRTPASAAETVPALAAVLVIAGPAGPDEGKSNEGKSRRYPVAGLTPTPLRGFDGQWGLGIPLPVSGLPPGEYQATLEVTAKPAGGQATAVTSFRVVAP